MSVGSSRGGSNPYSVVSGAGSGGTQTRELVSDEDLDEKSHEALEADDFIIFGKASVEQYDEDTPSQMLEMDAFEEQLETFLDGGIISRRHKDIPVGEPLREWQLEEGAEVEAGDTRLTIEPGDTIRSEVDPNCVEGDTEGELWIVANIRNDTELARETRLGAINGDLDGFSVTVFCKEWEETTKGQRVTDFDWHSVTIGSDEQIKNKDSRFGVAEFKATFGDELSMEGALEVLEEIPPDMSGDTSEKGFWDRVSEIADQKASAGDDAGGETEEQAEGKMDDKDGYEEDEDYEDEKSDVDRVLEKVRTELSDEDAQVLEKEMGGGPPEEMIEGEEGEEDDEEEGMPEAGELKSEIDEKLETLVDEAIEAKLDEAGLVTEETLEEKLEDTVTEEAIGEKLDERLPDDLATKADLDDVMESAEEVLEKAVEDTAEQAAEQTAQKAATGSTPDPAAGSGNDEVDYKSEIQKRFGTKQEAN